MRPWDMAATAKPRIIVGADSISARGVLRQRKALRANTVRPYILYMAKLAFFGTLRLPFEGSLLVYLFPNTPFW